jgi:SAM-dependent methyltransferase
MTPSTEKDKVTRDAVRWAYRLLLGREPESDTAVDGHVLRCRDIAALRRAFLGSEEFLNTSPAASRLTLHGDEPARTIEIDGPPELLRRLFEHVNRSWQHLGEQDPFWSVLTAPEYRGTPSAERIAEFFASGKVEVARLQLALSRIGVALDGRGRCVEYGCGVGRVTRHLAPLFEHMMGVDISQAHLRLAEHHARMDGVSGIEWMHLESLDSLGHMPEADFIYSMIVLQHNPPPVIERVLRRFAQMLRPGGIAYFQVPTYRADYEFHLAEYIERQLGRKEMEMHAFPQRRIFEIFADAGALPLQVVEDGATGARRGERSNTFAFRRR